MGLGEKLERWSADKLRITKVRKALNAPPGTSASIIRAEKGGGSGEKTAVGGPSVLFPSERRN